MARTAPLPTAPARRPGETASSLAPPAATARGDRLLSAAPGHRARPLTPANPFTSLWNPPLAAWLGRLAQRLSGRSVLIEQADPFAGFTEIAAAAQDAGTIARGLVGAAGALARAARVELIRDRGEPSVGVVARWPESAEPLAEPGESLALSLTGGPGAFTLRVQARSGPRNGFPPDVLRQLTTLCAIASLAFRAVPERSREAPGLFPEGSPLVRDATFLSAVLPYALAQACRHGEPVAVYCLEIDGLPLLATALGPAAVERIVVRVAEAVAGTLRGSDVVARLDDDRIVAVLPGAGPADAQRIATIVLAAADRACGEDTKGPPLFPLIGVACFPDDARDPISLLAAADEAITHTRAQTAACGSPFCP